MKNRRNNYAHIDIYVGRLKPINEGVYNRNFCKKDNKPTERVYLNPESYYFSNPIYK